jgi:hypothetical protein
VALLELKVQHNGIDGRVLQRLERGGLGFRVADHLDVIERRDGFGQSFADNRRVFHQEDAERMVFR